MIKGLALAVALFAGSAMSASAEVVFVGTIINTVVSPQCQNSSVGDRSPSVFHPAGILGNENFAGLSFIRSYYAEGHSLRGQNFDATFRQVETGGVGWGDTYFVSSPTTQSALIRVTSYSPALAAITNATRTITLQGQIRRLFRDPGGTACVVTFIATYVRDSNETPF